VAFKHGSKAAVWYGGYDLTAYFHTAELTATSETADTTTYGSTWRTFLPGVVSAEYSLEGLYDPAETAIQAALASAGNVLTIMPAGTTIGDAARLVPVITSEYGISDAIDSAVGISWGVTANDALAFGQVLHAFTEDTNTTTGAEKDDAAATATGWTANLHVSLVDGGSWVIKLQDAAVSNTYSDVTGGSFTAVTVPGAQQLFSASSTTALRRYVRYVATRTGGIAGNGITFGLTYARSNVG
jgi:hypothetical protein